MNVTLAWHEYECDIGCFIVFWLTMVKMAIVLLILTAIALKLFCNFYLYSLKFTPSKSEMAEIAKFFKITSIISIISAIICVIIDFIHIYQGYSTSKPLHKDAFHAIRAVADCAMFASFLLFYIYLYGRLIKSFKGTIFRLGSIFKMYTMVIFIIIIILNIWYIGLVSTDFNTNFNAHNQFYDDMHGIVYGIFTWFYLMLFLNIVGTFIYKLRELTIYSYNISNGGVTSRSSSPERPKLGRTESIGNNPQSHIEELVVIVTKQTVLLLFSLILFCVRFIFRHVIGTYYEEDNLPEIVWMLSYSWRDVVLLSNVFVMYLGFRFSEKEYTFCCKGCDKICRRMCIWTMDKENEDKVNKSISSGDNNAATDIHSANDIQLNVQNIPKQNV